MHNEHRRLKNMRRRGLTLVEAVLALLVMSVLATAALSAVAQARRTRAIVDQRSLGDMLARTMLSEITALPYKASGSTTIGMEGGEDPADRRTFDDADDYHLFSESPCLQHDGKSIDGTDNWERSVIVAWVPVGSLTTTSGTDTGLKRVWVNIKHNGRLVTRLSALRAQAWDDALASGGL